MPLCRNHLWDTQGQITICLRCKRQRRARPPVQEVPKQVQAELLVPEPKGKR